MPGCKELIIGFFAVILALTGGTTANADNVSLAPGYSQLAYHLPAVGSYQLPPMGMAADGKVLNSSGREQDLYQIFDGKYVLLSFIYSRCDDVNGCPLSSFVLNKIKAQMNKDPELANNLKLVSLSFDPEYDTAEILELMANNFKYSGSRGEWQFISTSSVKQLEPILNAYGQDIQREVSLSNSSSRFSHILRVFLIDPNLQIRNIYSVAFLHKDLLINDVKTLMQQDTAATITSSTVKNKEYDFLRPGDDKSNYETTDYVTHAQAVNQHIGKETDLYSQAKNIPLGLPAIPEPVNNPLSRNKIALGRKLFFDRRLSLNSTFSCAMCHVPDQGFTSNEVSTAVGIEGRSVRRNSPTIYNVAYANILFHDGRENTLEQQVWGPLLAKNEMGNPSVGHVIQRIKQLSDYDGLFEKAFDGRSVSMETLGSALASYQRTLVSADSAFDRWYYANNRKALSESAIRGFKLFTGKAGCSACHLINESYALFTDNKLHNTGIGYQASMSIRPETSRVQLAPGVYVEMDSSLIDQVGLAELSDVGQYEVTENPADRWKYKTPSLRNIGLTAPYMHNGKLGNLMEVVDFYNRGGVANLLLDKRIRPLGLTDQQKQDLVNFLQSLNGNNVEQLVSDAFAAPIGDVVARSNNGINVDVKNNVIKQ
jgi:cytochrome c peroxidase